MKEMNQNNRTGFLSLKKKIPEIKVTPGLRRTAVTVCLCVEFRAYEQLTSCFFRCIKVGFFLGLAYILLVSNSFISKPIRNLQNTPS